MTSQKDAIQKLFNQERYILILFDACRCDYFKKIKPKVKCMQSPATFTGGWFKRTFSDKYYDLTYVTANTWIGCGDSGFVPEEHFSKVIHVWRWADRDEIEEVTEATLENLTDKMMIHYMKPHEPYGGILSDKEARKQLLEGKITKEEVRKMYLNDIRDVWSEAKKIISKANQTVVVTSDHGDALGEDDHFGHDKPGKARPLLFNVPWLEIPDKESRIKESLQELGYL